MSYLVEFPSLGIIVCYIIVQLSVVVLPEYVIIKWYSIAHLTMGVVADHDIWGCELLVWT